MYIGGTHMTKDQSYELSKKIMPEDLWQPHPDFTDEEYLFAKIVHALLEDENFKEEFPLLVSKLPKDENFGRPEYYTKTTCDWFKSQYHSVKHYFGEELKISTHDFEYDGVQSFVKLMVDMHAVERVLQHKMKLKEEKKAKNKEERMLKRKIKKNGGI
jgi:hypothetical protein